MGDLAAKVKAIHELTDAWAASGDVELIDAALAILLLRSDNPKASLKAVPEAPARRKRGPYKQQQWYRALLQGAAPLEEIVRRAVALEPDCIPGETKEEKMKFVARKMRTSPSVYREFEDGWWAIRRRLDLHPPHHRSLYAQYSVRTDHLSESAYR
jgi:hypothetical protein